MADKQNVANSQRNQQTSSPHSPPPDSCNSRTSWNQPPPSSQQEPTPCVPGVRFPGPTHLPPRSRLPSDPISTPNPAWGCCGVRRPPDCRWSLPLRRGPCPSLLCPVARSPAFLTAQPLTTEEGRCTTPFFYSFRIRSRFAFGPKKRAWSYGPAVHKPRRFGQVRSLLTPPHLRTWESVRLQRPRHLKKKSSS